MIWASRRNRFRRGASKAAMSAPLKCTRPAVGSGGANISFETRRYCWAGLGATGRGGREQKDDEGESYQDKGRQRLGLSGQNVHLPPPLCTRRR